jgi:hypothetical protein
MARRFWLVITVILSGACGSSPASPTPPNGSGSTSASYHGATVSAVDGQPIARVTLKIGSQTAVSDANGAFQLPNVNEGSQTVVLSGDSVVERQTTVKIPSAEPARESLIPVTFDLGAFDQMFRGTGHLQRWTNAPGLVVLVKAMQYETFGTGDEYHATSEELTEAETSQLIEQLTEGLALLTGNTFTAFASIELDNPASGARVNTLRTGQIVVGRYKGVQSLANTVGFGRWATDGTGQVTGGSIYLDRDFDRSTDKRRLLRIHELGHALGYLHVTSRTSIMNPFIGPEPTAFDSEGANVAFQRMPGNQSPDTDLDTSAKPSSGGIFGIGPVHSTILWSKPIICGPATLSVPQS